jgi:hypothetical protein
MVDQTQRSAKQGIFASRADRLADTEAISASGACKAQR